MARITTTPTELLVELTTRERLAALHRDLRVPLAAVRDVRVEPDALRAVEGIRAPGLAIPGVVKLGTWRRRGGRALVAARRGVPAVRVELDGVRPDRVLVSTPDAEAVAAEVRAAAAGAAV